MTFKEDLYNDFISDFSIVLREKLKDLEISKLIFLCIGTDRVTGDSFGPLVGYKLRYLFKEEESVEIIGHLGSTVCSCNIQENINYIKNTYENPFIIAIDAAMSNNNNIGKIIVSKNGMYVGSGLRKRNIYAGDMSIKAIVSRDLEVPKYNFRLLQNISLNLVMNMADCVAQGICDVINV